MKGVRLVVPVWLLLAACADAPAEGNGPETVPPGTPDVVEIVCEADGSTTLRTPEVVVQRDGIHVHVISRLDEPAEMVGVFGQDVEAGETTYVSLVAPGSIGVACNPFSQHGDDRGPDTLSLKVHDPAALYVEGELECDGGTWGGVSDFAGVPADAGPVPLTTARAAIRGLRRDDEVLYVGYPEEPEPSVAVRRDGKVVGLFGFVTFNGKDWFIEGSEGCSSSGLEWS